MRPMTHPGRTRLLGIALVFCLSDTAALFAQDQAPAATKLATAAKKPSIYDKTADTQVQLAKAMETAKRDDKRILVMFGGDWCGWCHKLHELFASDAEIRKVLSYEYVLVMVDTDGPGCRRLAQEVQGGAHQGRAAKGNRISVPGRARRERQGCDGSEDRSPRRRRPS